jgi:GH25 family lysozyme M1 (1,4-beta-N-acetylmuramidase)
MTTKAMPVHGADLSHHNSQTIDLPKAIKAGLQWLYHKATEGDSMRDQMYVVRRGQARIHDLPFGAYHFARPEKGDAVTEAQRFLAVADPKPGDLRPVLDLESDEGMSLDALRAWSKTWCEVVAKAVGIQPIIYTPFDLKPVKGILLWRPRYNNTNTPPVLPWDIWQFSNGVFGIPNTFPGLGHVDLNTMRTGLTLKDLLIPKPLAKSGVIRFVSQNVRSKPQMPQADVVHDVELTGSQAGVVAWQEIGFDRYKQAVLDLGPEFDSYIPDGAGNSNPVSWRDSVWTQCAAGEILLNKADPTSTVRGSDRFLVWVLIKHNGTGAFVLVNNAHYVARAWGHRTGQEAKEQPIRQEMWLAANKIHRAAVKDWVDKGYAIVCMGDYNSSNARELPLGKTIGGRTVRYVVGDKSIDQVIFINGKDFRWEIEDLDGEILPGRNSDHQGRRGQARLVERP